MTTIVQDIVTATPPLRQRSVSISRINIKNLLSFGSKGLGDGAGLELLPLNILIGANGSGKSNFIDVVNLLQAAATDLIRPFTQLDEGVGQWLWNQSSGDKKATIEVIAHYPEGFSDLGNDWLRYQLSFSEGKWRDLIVADELLENADVVGSFDHPFRYLLYEQGVPKLGRRTSSKNNHRELRPAEVEPQQSILSNRWEAGLYPEIAYISQLFSSFRFYRDWSFGRSSPVRRPKRMANTNFLDENADNLAGVIANLTANQAVKAKLLEYMSNFSPSITDVQVKPLDYYDVLNIKEDGKLNPASRISDGTLRWLALLAVLLHPNPPKLICLEEPEIGLHPDMMLLLANLLRQAAKRTQIIVTTHSELLVGKFTDTPECVVVCEKREGTTQMRRLSRRLLANWLDDYTLGQLWSMNITGGNS